MRALSRRHAQVLELAAPEYDWDRFAERVHAMDSLKRPVPKNRRFTWRWSETVFENEKNSE
jgi:hypothetical protein